ncbi:stage II sporulation protein P [Bacillus niameyensis]|uniref:stage II sporulation protein P n=1 Tax=Bacillus niameyensis TaxID=1522308 RepID=UPI000783C3DC|nr:stage II sporulation protein P [Bacillus niameyensis]
MFKIAARSTLSIIAIFCLTSVIAFSSIKVSSLSFLGNDFSRSESLLYIMSLENHSFTTVLPNQQERSLGEVALEIFTNINLADMKTFLITEISGLRAVTPKILIAGEGTDFTNLPIESPPPDDFAYWGEDESDAKEDVPKDKPLTKDFKAYIYHSHNYESFFDMVPGAKTPNEAFHKEKNISMLGKRLGEKLEEKGIKTLVETTDIQALLVERNMKYYQSYTASREVATEAIKQNKDVELVFDLHRDAARRGLTTIEIGGKNYAKSMFVIGTGNPNFEQNLEMANSLHQILQKKYPGLSRGAVEKPKTSGSNGVYNQDLASHSLLIEIGGVDNTEEELNRTVDALAEVISEYYWGEAVETSK